LKKINKWHENNNNNSEVSCVIIFVKFSVLPDAKYKHEWKKLLVFTSFKYYFWLPDMF